jgi:hypothetical protein
MDYTNFNSIMDYIDFNSIKFVGIAAIAMSLRCFVETIQVDSKSCVQ